MGKQHALKRRKRSAKAHFAARRWHLPHLMVAAGILVALAASVPVGAYLKASVLLAQTTCPAGETGTPPSCSGATSGGGTQTQACPSGTTGTYPNCTPVNTVQCPGETSPMHPTGFQCPQPTNTVQCPGETSPMHPTGFICPTAGTTGTQTGTTGTYMCNGVMIPNTQSCTQTGTQSESQMQAGCLSAGGTWKGMTATPPCQMPGTTNTGTTGNTGSVPTMADCASKGMGWDAAKSQCTSTPTPTPGANMGNPTADCWNQTNLARYSSTECTAARAAANNTQTSMPWCPQLNRNATPAECSGSTKAPAGMIECPNAKTPSGMPMYGRDANECAKMLADQVKWQSEQNTGSGDCWNSTNTARFASAECTAIRAKQNDANQWKNNDQWQQNDQWNKNDTWKMMPVGPMPYFPSAPCPTSTATFNSTNGSTMPCGSGMTGDQGNQHCPPGDPFCGQFFDPEKGFKGVNFDKYKIRTDDFDPNQYKVKNVNMERGRLKGEVTRLKQEKKQLNESLTRLSKRSGVACPVATEYQAAVAQLESAVTSIEAATASTATTEQVQQALSLLDGINGDPMKGKVGLFMKLHGYMDQDAGEFVPGLDQQIGGCEMLGEFVREVARRSKEIDSMVKRAEQSGIAKVVEAYKEIKAELDKAAADPVAWSGASLSEIMAPPSSECFGGYGGGPGGGPSFGGFGSEGFGGPSFGSGPQGFGPQGFGPQGGPSYGPQSRAYVAQLEDDFREGFGDDENFEGPMMPEMDEDCMPGPQKYLFNKLNKLFMNIGKIERQAHKEFESQMACKQLEQIDGFVSSGHVPSFMKPFLKEINGYLDEGAKACDAGDSKGAFAILKKMQSLKDKVMKSGDFDESEFEDVELGVNEDNIVNNRLKNIKESAGDELSAKALAALEARYKDIISKLEDKIALLSEKVAQMTDQLAKINVELSKDATLALNNVAKAPEVAQETISAAVNTVTEVAAETSDVIESKGLSAATEQKFEDFINTTLESAPTGTLASTIASELDSVTQEMAGSDKKTAEKVLGEFITNAKKLIAAEKPEAKVEAGVAAFTDTVDPTSYIYSEAFKAKELGIVAGEGGKPVFGVSNEMNGAQMVCMGARTVLGKEATDAGSKEAIPGVKGPEWFNACANAMLESKFITLDELKNITNGDAAKPVNRADVAEAIHYVGVHAGVLPNVTSESKEEILQGVTDAKELSRFTAAEQQAILVLKDEGLMTGNKHADGTASIDGDDRLQKGPGATLWVRLADRIEQEKGATETSASDEE